MDCGFATPQAFANITFCISRRVARIWERGGLFWKSEKCANDLDSNFHWSWISFRRFVQKLRARKFKAFFRPTLGDLQKKKVFAKIESDFSAEIRRFFPPKIRWSPKKKRSSPKLRLIFRLLAQIHTFEGGCFRMGGVFSIFHKQSASKTQKTCDFAYFRSQWGGPEPPPPAPPWLRFCVYPSCLSTIIWARTTSESDLLLPILRVTDFHTPPYLFALNSKYIKLLS